MALGAVYNIPKVKGLKLDAQAGFDAGDLYPSNFGVLVSLSYEGLIKFKKGK